MKFNAAQSARNDPFVVLFPIRVSVSPLGLFANARKPGKTIISVRAGVSACIRSGKECMSGCRCHAWAYTVCVCVRTRRGYRAERGAPKCSLDSTRAAESIHQPSPVRSLRPPQNQSARTNEHLPSHTEHPLSLCLVSFLVWLSPCSVLSLLVSPLLPSRHRTIDQPSHANTRFKNARLLAPNVRAASVFLSALSSVNFALSPPIETEAKNFRS